MLWPPETAEYEFTAARAQTPDGETVGWYRRSNHTIHVNSGPFGGGVVPLVVTRPPGLPSAPRRAGSRTSGPAVRSKVAYELYHGRGSPGASSFS